MNAIVVERYRGDLRLEPLQLPHFVAVLLLQRVELLPHVRVLPRFREVSFSAKYKKLNLLLFLFLVII